MVCNRRRHGLTCAAASTVAGEHTRVILFLVMTAAIITTQRYKL